MNGNFAIDFTGDSEGVSIEINGKCTGWGFG